MDRLRFIAICNPDGFSDLTHYLEMARALSPRVEMWPPHGVLLEVPSRYETATLQQLLRTTRTDPHFNIGTACTRTAAFLAAHAAPGTAVPPRKECDFLAPLPIDLLFLHPALFSHELQPNSAVSFRSRLGQAELSATFARWGIRTLGELAALSESELVARLGQEVIHLQKVARGEDITPFQEHLPEPCFEVTHELEWTLDSLEPLAFVLAGLLDRLCSDLQGHGLATDSLRVLLKLANRTSYERTLRLAFPTHNPKLLLTLLRLDLQSHPLQAAISRVTLQAQPAHLRVFQYSLLQPTLPSPEKLSRTLGRLTALVGEGNVGSPSLLDTYRPDAFKMGSLRTTEQKRARVKELVEQSMVSDQPSTVRQLSLRRIRPPVPIRIRSSQIVARAGPWRSSGHWWSEGWSRDEWDIEFVDGTIYRIYRDHHRKAWFLEGIYD